MTDGTVDRVDLASSQIANNDWWTADDIDEVEGQDLLRDEALKDIVGLPFLAYKAVYRDGIQRKNVEYRDDYVSVELRVAPYVVVMRSIDRIQARRKSYGVPVLSQAQTEELAGEQFVVNDGSTGLYRQITQYLVGKEHLVLPDGPEAGEKGECIYDLPRSQWLAGAEAATAGIPIGLRCARGLRYSEYDSPYLPEGERATTWYIA
jgi:hypothetical protein